MASSDVSSVTKFFSTSAEGFTTTLGSTISAGALSVSLNSTTGLTNGAVFVGIIEPGATAQQVFTGTVDVSGSQITNVVWTRGTNVGHAGGVTIVDYVTGTAHNMMTKGLLVAHEQTGLHKSGASYPLAAITDFTNAQHNHSNAAGGGQIANSGISGVGSEKISIPYKFSAYQSSQQTQNGQTTAKVSLQTELFDTGNNFDSGTNYRFTAPVAGFYLFDAAITVAIVATATLQSFLYKNGSEAKKGSMAGNSTAAPANMTSNITAILQLSANDYVELYATNNQGSSVTFVTGSSSTYLEGTLLGVT